MKRNKQSYIIEKARKIKLKTIVHSGFNESEKMNEQLERRNQKEEEKIWEKLGYEFGANLPATIGSEANFRVQEGTKKWVGWCTRT